MEAPDSRQTNSQYDERGLLMGTPDSKQTNFQNNQTGSINDFIQWSEEDLSMCFLPFMCDVKAASFIMATLTSLEQ